MKKSSRKPLIITLALAAYAIVMARYNVDTLTVYHDYLRYFGTLAAEVVILIVLYFFLRRRERLKAERERDMEHAEQLRSAASKKEERLTP